MSYPERFCIEAMGKQSKKHAENCSQFGLYERKKKKKLVHLGAKRKGAKKEEERKG